MDERLLDILIPTLNREEELIKNVRNIQHMVVSKNLGNEIGIIISDNGSAYESFKKLDSFLKNKCSIQYELFRQEKNIGIEDNVLFLISKSHAKYVMTLGDDDYFTESYLLSAIYYLRMGKYVGVISNPYAIDKEGKKIGEYRDPITKDRIYDKEDLWISDRGHQLSCLIFLRTGVVEAYRKNVRKNVYPFVYFLAYNIQKGEIVHITREPYGVTTIPKKNWDYSFDNLMGELCIVFDCLPYQSLDDKKRQLRKMILENANRYCNRQTYFHPIKLYNKVESYEVSNTIKDILKKVYLQQCLTLPFRLVKRYFKALNERYVHN